MPASRSMAVTASSWTRSRSSWRASVQRFSCRTETVPVAALPGIEALQDYDGDLARRLRAVLEKLRIDARVLLVEALVLIGGRYVGARLEPLPVDFDGHLWMLDQVVEPRRVHRSTSLGGNDDVVLAVAGVYERILTLGGGLRPLGGEDQHIAAHEGPGCRLSLVRAKVLDQVAIEVKKT